jgi:hypothetical protein
MKYVKKRDLVIIGILLILILVLTILVVDYSKTYFSRSTGVDFDGDVEFNEFLLEKDISSNDSSSFKDKVISYGWINDSILEINASLFLVCGCEKIKKVNYMIYSDKNSLNKLAIYYETFIDNEESCANCVLPHGIRFRVRDISKEDYDIILVKFHESS